MPGKILGLEISDTYITATEVLNGLKGSELLSCLSIPVENNDIQSALKDISSKLSHEEDRCIVSIPLSSISFRNIRVPFKDDKNIRQTLPFEMETLVPFSADEMIFDYSIIDNTDGANILTAGIYKEEISNYLELLLSSGFDPDIIDINAVPVIAWVLDQQKYPNNGIYLGIGYEQQSLIIFQKGRIVIIREFNNHFKDKNENSDDSRNQILEKICTEVEITVHSYNSNENDPVAIEKIFFGGNASSDPNIEKFLSNFFKTPAERINIIDNTNLFVDQDKSEIFDHFIMSNSLANALREHKKGRGFNFRRDEFEAKRSYFKTGPEFKKSAILFILLIALIFFDTGIDFYNLNRKLKKVEQKYDDERLKRFPESKNYKYPHMELKQRLAELENSTVQLPGGINPDHMILDILKDISQRISDSIDVEVSNMVVDPDTVRITGETDSFNTVDGLKNRLEPSNLFKNVTISSANLDKTGKRVRFELKLTRSKFN